ncbi:MAG: hypothetical protein Q9223_003296 [Gallowayella weberi]
MSPTLPEQNYKVLSYSATALTDHIEEIRKIIRDTEDRISDVSSASQDTCESPPPPYRSEEEEISDILAIFCNPELQPHEVDELLDPNPSTASSEDSTTPPSQNNTVRMTAESTAHPFTAREKQDWDSLIPSSAPTQDDGSKGSEESADEFHSVEENEPKKQKNKKSKFREAI